MIDPLSRAVWLDRVPQEHGILAYVANRHDDVVLGAVVIAMVLGLSAGRALEARRRGEAAVPVCFAVAVSALGLALAQMRFLPFAAAFAALFVPALLSGGAALAARPRWAALLGAAPVALAVAAYGLMPKADRTPTAIDIMAADECDGADFSALALLEPGRIMAPMGLSFALLEHGGGHTVAALPYHRASPGIRRMALAFTSDDNEARQTALAPFDYVAVCRRRLPDGLDGAPLYLALSSGRDWPGLTAIGEPAARLPALALFRVDAAAPD